MSDNTARDGAIRTYLAAQLVAAETDENGTREDAESAEIVADEAYAVLMQYVSEAQWDAWVDYASRHRMSAEDVARVTVAEFVRIMGHDYTLAICGECGVGNYASWGTFAKCTHCDTEIMAEDLDLAPGTHLIIVGDDDLLAVTED